MAARCGHATITRLLLSCHKIDVNRALPVHHSPLFSACLNRQLEIVELLTGVPECDVNTGSEVLFVDLARLLYWWPLHIISPTSLVYYLNGRIWT
jgi:hypothetical protein